jgi:putative SOS response-associated peptidase YedK
VPGQRSAGTGQRRRRASSTPDASALKSAHRSRHRVTKIGSLPGDPGERHAHSETLAEKPSFRSAVKRRRCLILADGFYEWQKTPGQRTRTPHYIRLSSGDPFTFAGLWESWRSPDDDRVPSFTIITASPNPLMAQIHDRMPVILDPDDHARWFQEGKQPKVETAALLKPYPPVEMEAYPVLRLVNSPRNDVKGCVEPAGPPSA